MSAQSPVMARRRTATTSGRPSIRSCARRIRQKRSHFLHHLQSELNKAQGLHQNDGSHESPVKEAAEEAPIEIDLVDQLTPDS
jgi:hypothetical protein